MTFSRINMEPKIHSHNFSIPTKELFITQSRSRKPEHLFFYRTQISKAFFFCSKDLTFCFLEYNAKILAKYLLNIDNLSLIFLLNPSLSSPNKKKRTLSSSLSSKFLYVFSSSERDFTLPLTNTHPNHFAPNCPVIFIEIKKPPQDKVIKRKK